MFFDPKDKEDGLEEYGDRYMNKLPCVNKLYIVSSVIISIPIS